MNKEKDLRMVVLVPYNLSDIQKGIQALHAVAEYSLRTQGERLDHIMSMDTTYMQWAREHKTVIVLNGGTTGKGSTMHRYKDDLENLGVTYSEFREPDLNMALTAIAFIVDYKNDTHIVQYLRSMKLA